MWRLKTKEFSLALLGILILVSIGACARSSSTCGIVPQTHTRPPGRPIPAASDEEGEEFHPYKARQQLRAKYVSQPDAAPRAAFFE